MKLLEFIAVKHYFYTRLKKVYARDGYVSFPSQRSLNKGLCLGRLIPFSIGFIKKRVPYKNWLNHSFGVCYEHASSILLALNKEDKCVIGKLDMYKSANFYHAWNEFTYNNKQYVFEYENKMFYEKDTFYQRYQASVIQSYTLKQILEDYKEFIKPENQYDLLDIPRCLPDDKYGNIPIPTKQLRVIDKNSIYEGSKIKFNKKGEIVSVLVDAHQIE